MVQPHVGQLYRHTFSLRLVPPPPSSGKRSSFYFVFPPTFRFIDHLTHPIDKHNSHTHTGKIYKNPKRFFYAQHYRNTSSRPIHHYTQRISRRTEIGRPTDHVVYTHTRVFVELYIKTHIYVRRRRRRRQRQRPCGGTGTTTTTIIIT